MSGSLQQPCPCGSGTTYDACCGRLHRGAEQAATPEELMRSRYAAYVVGAPNACDACGKGASAIGNTLLTALWDFAVATNM